MRHVVATGLLLSIAAAGCVWTPPNGSSQKSNASFTISGWATSGGQGVTIKARSWNDDTPVSITSATASTVESYPGSGLYPWSATITPSMLPKSVWMPGNLGVVASGPPAQLELSAYQSSLPTMPMYTFTEAARSCFWEKYNAGSSQRDAGSACSDGTTVSSFDVGGYGVDTPAIDWKLEASGSPLGSSTVVEIVSYRSGPQRVYGVICRPNDANKHRTAIFNHGGMLGIEQSDENICGAWAQAGWVFAMTAYRAEYLDNQWALVRPVGGILPAGKLRFAKQVDLTTPTQVETSLGEVQDVHRLLDGLRAHASVDANKLLMLGHSHGGAITLRALETGAKVRAAVLRAPASSWAQIYDDCGVATWPNGRPHNPLCDCLRSGTGCVTGAKSLPTMLGGTPQANLRAYDWRSPLFFTKDLQVRKDVTVFVQHGVADDVVQVDQSCQMTAAAWGKLFPNAWHVDVAAKETDAAVPDCQSTDVKFLTSARPTSTWKEGERYFMAYDGLEHLLQPAPTGVVPPYSTADVDLFNFVSWLAATWG